MKLSKIFIFIMTLAAWLPVAQADTVPFPQDGDLFMGFHSSTATNEYLWDFGPSTTFDGLPIGTTITVGNISADLVTVFGSNWATDTNIQWGAVGNLDAISVLFASAAGSETAFANAWTRQSTASQANTGSTINTMVFGDYAGQDATSNNPTAVIHPSTGLSWASFNNGPNSPGGSFNAWVPTIEAPITVPFGTGLPATRLDFFRIDPDDTGTNPPSQYIGSFTVDAAGTVTFEVLDSTKPPPTPTPTPTPTPSGTPTPTPSSTPTPTASVTPTPSVSPSPTPSPTATPNTSLANISTRLSVGTGDNVMIAGFIAVENATTKAAVAPKRVLIRALGPSLASQNVPDVLANPVLSLYDSTGTQIATNDNWKDNDSATVQAIIDTGIPPSNDLEAALLLPLAVSPASDPKGYTAIVTGLGGGTGNGLVEVYDLDGDGTSNLANISTRGFVQTGDNVMIGGVIVLGDGPADLVVRAIGPTLPLSNALLDPTLDIYNGNGALMFTNDNWKDTQEAAIEASGLAPTDDRESAIISTFDPGNYTAIVRGANGTTGNALVEVFHLSQ